MLDNERLAECLRRDFDLILVDEFQDTNPLQLAIFRRLRRLAPANRCVGDPKQAINGFRGSDPQLVDEVWRDAPNVQRTELQSNYRSQRGLVQFVGSVFAPIFGNEAIQKSEHAPETRGIERWLLEGKNKSDEALSLGCGIAMLRDEGVRLW